MSKYKDCKNKLSSRIEKYNYEYTSESGLEYMELLDNHLSENQIQFTSNKVLKKQAHIKVEKKEFIIDTKTFAMIKKTFPKRNGQLEYHIGRMLNTLKQEIPNFMYTFSSPTPNTDFMIEYIDGITISQDIAASSGLSEDECNKKYASILLQVFMALFVAFAYYGYVHNDLHQENVMIVTYPTERWITYHLRPLNKKVSIFTKYLPIIIDYGLSQIDENDQQIIMTGFEQYDLDPNYCIPIRDYVKFCYGLGNSPQIENMLTFLFNDHPSLFNLFLHRASNLTYLSSEYNILPCYKRLLSESARNISIRNLQYLYNLTPFDVISHLFTTLPSKLSNFINIEESFSIHKIPIFLKYSDENVQNKMFYKQLSYLYLNKLMQKNVNLSQFSKDYSTFKDSFDQLLKKINDSAVQRISNRRRLSLALSYLDEIYVVNQHSLNKMYGHTLIELYKLYQNHILSRLK